MAGGVQAAGRRLAQKASKKHDCTSACNSVNRSYGDGTVMPIRILVSMVPVSYHLEAAWLALPAYVCYIFISLVTHGLAQHKHTLLHRKDYLWQIRTKNKVTHFLPFIFKTNGVGGLIYVIMNKNFMLIRSTYVVTGISSQSHVCKLLLTPREHNVCHCSSRKMNNVTLFCEAHLPACSKCLDWVCVRYLWC